MAERIVVLGAGSGIGHEIARQLVAEGRPVRAVTRSGRGTPDGADSHRADLMDRDAAIAACAGATVVHLTANPPYPDWVRMLPTIVTNSLAGAEAAGAKLVLADNLYAYGPVSGPITEDTPERPVGPKERLRAELGRRLLDAHRAGRVRVALGRSSDYYGPGGLKSLHGITVLAPLAKGGIPMWLGDLDVPHTLPFLGDTARAQIVLGDDDRADGRVWITPAAPTLTGREFVATAARLAGRPGRRALRLPQFTTAVLGLVDRTVRGAGELAHQRTRPWIADHSAFERTFGPLPVTPHEEAITRTLAWYRAGGASPTGRR
ncbi:NAD-dependent epimerase/dehydratase family protein [Goodfellowiella coeruleoviolacea]|uniref:Nucleoside-diphosphate-sugar epimerase n=1 Tax=Goodfellowiella coeruleoviolacea TaxID=334858 RepID=A0AAE3GBZ5_9PSEU|nr:NAD-dependent epimerase/dehydratase family protein [Goodfellowiella coeruleoviolacea]MCP2165491.1 Nucleoside-diphosphate-sugar epimerase [Goodfellowiella coeruleoviolacea]